MVSSKRKTGTAVYICCREHVPGKGYDIFKIQGQMWTGHILIDWLYTIDVLQTA